MSNEKKHGLKHIGKKLKNKRGDDVEVIDGGSRRGYNIAKITPKDGDVYVSEVRFERLVDSINKEPETDDVVCVKLYSKLCRRYGIQHIGKVFKSKYGYDIEVIGGGLQVDYVQVRLYGDNLQDHIMEVQMSHVRNGQVKHPYAPSVYGVGYVGVGKHKPSFNRKDTKAYEKWNGMLERCYSDKWHVGKPTYKGVTVCKKWHNFQNFAEWYEKYYVDGYELDKDLLALPNVPKRYCENTCVFIPHVLNAFIRHSDAKGWSKDKGAYKAVIKVNKVNTHLGSYNTPEEAYKEYRDVRAKQALNWKLMMSKVWKPHLESKDKSISGKYQRAIDNIR